MSGEPGWEQDLWRDKGLGISQSAVTLGCLGCVPACWVCVQLSLSHLHMRHLIPILR